MIREVFIVKNNTISDIELKDFGIIIPSGVTIDLGDYDKSLISNELNSYLISGDLIRVIDGNEVGYNESYLSNVEPISIYDSNYIKVSKTGGTFNSIQEAIDSITGATDDNKYYIHVNSGDYYEDITLKSYVFLEGLSNNMTRIYGDVNINMVDDDDITKLKDIQILTTNKPILDIDTNGYVYLYNCNLYNTWTNDTFIKTVFDIKGGNVNIGGQSNIYLTDNYTGSTITNTFCYYVNGSDKSVNFRSDKTVHMKYIYGNNQNIGLLYNNKDHSNNLCEIKDSISNCFLYGDSPENKFYGTLHSGSTSRTDIDATSYIINSENDASNVICMSSYNSNSNVLSGSSIDISFSNFNWGTNIVDDNFYIGAAITYKDTIRLISCNFETIDDIIPQIYTDDGNSGVYSYNIYNGKGTFYNSELVLTNKLAIGDINSLIMNDISDDTTLSSNSVEKLVTEHAIKSYVDNITDDAHNILYSNTGWTGTGQNVGSFLDDSLEVLTKTNGNGYFDNNQTIYKSNDNEITVLSGNGYISYENLHKFIEWSGFTIDTTDYNEGSWFITFDYNNNLDILSSGYTYYDKLLIGQFYKTGGEIGGAQSSGRRLDDINTRIHDYATRLGPFIYDKGGIVETLGSVVNDTAMKLKFTSCKVQNVLDYYDLDEVTTNEATTNFFVWYVDSNNSAKLDYSFLLNNGGKISIKSYNDTSGDSEYQVTGGTVSFTNGSKTVTSTSNLTGELIIGDYIYAQPHTSVYMNRIDNINYDGTGTTITLEFDYSAPTITGATCISVKSLKDIPEGKYTKHIFIRSSDGKTHMIYGQQLFDDRNEALSGPLPGYNDDIERFTIKVASLIITTGLDTLNGQILDLRPLPFNLSSGSGGSGGVTIHGALSGLLEDDHLQYLRTDGTRDITGKISYDNNKNFTNDNELISKKYVDDNLELRSSTGHTHTSFNNDLIIYGDLTVSGTTVSVNTTDMNVYDNIILINSGETGSGVSKGTAGIEVDRGSLDNYRFVLDDTDTNNPLFKIGAIGNYQTVATREDSPTDGNIATWNDTLKRFDTTISTSDFAPIVHDHVVSDITDIDTYYYNKTQVNTLLDGKSNTDHTHTESDIIDLNTYYYNKMQVNTLLSNKSDVGHEHNVSDITDLNTYYYDKNDVNDLLLDYSVTGHTHDTDSITNLSDYNNFNFYYDKIETDNLLDGKIDTGQTISWDNLDFSGSSISDLENKESIDIDYIETNWNITNVEDGLNKLTDYIENTQASGRLEPNNVLFGRLSNTLTVSGGTGFINYENFHKKITWTGTTFDTTGYSEGNYYVYVNSNSEVLISSSYPNDIYNITLGAFYHGGFIGVIQQCGCIIKSSINEIISSLIRQGIFIYDNGGKVDILSGNTLKIVSPPCKIQSGLISNQLLEVSSDDASDYKFLNYYNSNDYDWALNYHFNLYGDGKIYTNRWNDVTKDSYNVFTGYTVTFTQYSNTVTCDSDLTSLDLENSFIYELDDSDTYMTPVSGVSWDGTGTTITLETIYLGSSTGTTMVANYSLPKLPDGKYAKHLIIRSSDDIMYFILAEIYYSSEENAINGVLPSIPSSLQEFAIKMAYIVNVSNETDLTGKVYDIRPLPYQYKEGGQTGGGSSVTNHGDLTGLSNDDHLQYLRTDGNRLLTGIQKYQSHPIFTTDLDVVDKKYVDDGLSLKSNTDHTHTVSNITNINTYYYTKTNINDFFSGTTSISGYNKPNWDTAYTNTHTHSNKSYLDAVGNNTIWHTGNLNNSNTNLITNKLLIHRNTGSSSIIAGTNNGDYSLYLDSLESGTTHINHYVSSNVYMVHGGGNVSIGSSSSFDALNPQKLLVTSDSESVNIISAKGNLDDYLQLDIQNTSGGTFSSADIVASNDLSTEDSYYVDLGINSSNYSDPNYSMSGPNDSYLYASGGHLSIATETVNKYIKFFVGGTTSSDQKAVLDTDGNFGINSSTFTSKLQIADNSTKVGQTPNLLSLRSDDTSTRMELLITRNSNTSWDIQSVEQSVSNKVLRLNPNGGDVSVNNFSIWHTGNFNPDSKADTGTTLSDYGITDVYTITEIDILLSNKADTGTTLNDYGITDAYTINQIDSLLDDKSNTGHTHTESEITDLDHDAQKIKGKVIDDTNIGDGRPLIYDLSSDTMIYKSLLDTMPSVQARRTTNYTVTTAWTNITFDTVDIESKSTVIYKDLTNTDRFYVLEDGYYYVSLSCQVTCTTVTTQTSIRLLKNNSTLIPGSESYINSYQGEVHELTSKNIIQLNAGDYIIGQTLRNETDSTLLADTEFVIFKLDGIKGDKGDTGSGSSISIQDSSINVANTPHTTLNFIGDTVSATDAGNGVANITIQNIYGSEFQYIQNNTPSTTTATTPQIRDTLTTTSLPLGTYKLTVSYIYSRTSKNNEGYADIQVDGVTQGDQFVMNISDTTTVTSNTKIIYLENISGIKTITLRYWNDGSSTTIYDSIIELIRVT